MIELRTPNGLDALVPECEAEDPSPHFDADDLAGIASYYQANGYVVIKGALAPSTCDRMRALWDGEVKPSTAPIYRQETSRLERHRLNPQGWVMNPILNPHSVDPRRFPGFRRASRDLVLNSAGYARVLQTLFGGERPKVVQAMYFEGNSETWEHQDSHYLDSEHIGSLAGVWFALEDIAPQAGRFFVCPGTHRFDWPRRSLKDNVVDGHDAYIRSMLDTLRRSGAEVRSPALRKGDAVIWNACTIHGSLGTQDERHSRSSFTVHAIPASHRFLRLHHTVTDVPTEDIGNVLLHAPRDLALPRHRAVAWCEENFPRPFWAIKKRLRRIAIRLDGLRTRKPATPPPQARFSRSPR